MQHLCLNRAVLHSGGADGDGGSLRGARVEAAEVHHRSQLIIIIIVIRSLDH